MYSFEIVEINNPKWNIFIKNCSSFDFYHTSCYHKLEEVNGATPTLFVAKSDQETICLPLVIKQISNTSYFDATSVYGYCGPVASKPISKIEKSLIAFFKNEFLSFCKQNKIVSVFSRLHSLIPQFEFFANFGQVNNLNKTVSIDLSLSLEEQRKSFRKSNKSEINQLKGKKGYIVQKIDKTDDQNIKKFIEIYYENMKRVGAKDYYFFNLNYFKQLINNSSFDSDLLIATKEGVITSGAIFTKASSIMQYHLAGTKEEFSQDKPMKLILDEARAVGTSEGLKFLHLGGGVGGSDDDSLFQFKAGFSKNFHQFSVWNLIVNQEVYQELVMQKNLKQEDYPNFFPLYRAQ